MVYELKKKICLFEKHYKIMELLPFAGVFVNIEGNSLQPLLKKITTLSKK